jgi:excinuclease ABC subunit A
LLYARIGVPYCPNHNIPITAQTPKEMADKILSYPDNTKVIILSPVARNKKGTFKDLFERLLKTGFIRVRIDGEYKLIEEIELTDKNYKHDIDIVIDRLVLHPDERSRILDSLEIALKWSDGLAIAVCGDDETLFSSKFSCPHCGFSVPKLEPKLFSFNSPMGACPDCYGLGLRKEVDLSLLIPDEDLSIREGAIRFYKNMVNTELIEWKELEVLCKHYGIDMTLPWKYLSENEKRVILIGSDAPIKYQIETRSGNIMNRFSVIEGIKTKLERLYMETNSEMMRTWYGSYITDVTCKTCHGKRLNDQALAVRIGGLNIHELTSLSVVKIKSILSNLKLNETEQEIAKLLLKEINNRLDFLINVGLEYLTLARNASTLSGGEAQRIRLATQIGSKLTGVLYVLDEPSIGLHPRDNKKLINTLKDMRDLGNTLIVVEHDDETMLSADYLVDIGPGSGVHGGEIVAVGTPEEVMKNPKSITGRYLSGKEKIEVPKTRRKGNGKSITIKGASGNNLKNIDVEIPLGKLVVVTGVSGSGKSTLINDTLCTSVSNAVNRKRVKTLPYKELEGLENIDKLIEINQDPIGRTPRSNPATYTGVFDFIRTLFSLTKEARIRGYDKARFSFNVKGGRCEKCQGDGVIKVPMHFLPDVYVQCEECGGSRYSEEILQVTYKEKNIHDVLEMTVEEALAFFNNIPNIKRRIQTLYDVGLGYIKLGQSATTLSGGEAQRLKLASELQKKATGQTLYVLDEPTTGLHNEDVKKLINVIQRIVDNGDTVIVIEHNLDVIKNADHIIDLGPEGGDEGGKVVAIGTPEEVAKCKKSYTGQYLLKVLK